MNRIAKWLIRLYPRAWRGRYGSEFEALIDDSNAGWRDAFDVLKGAMSMQSVRWPVIVGECAALGALAGFVASFLLPQVYIARASIAVTAGDAPGDAVAATIQRAMSGQSLAQVIRAQDLYSKDLLNKPVEDVVDRMRRHIRIAALPRAPILEVSSYTKIAGKLRQQRSYWSTAS